MFIKTMFTNMSINDLAVRPAIRAVWPAMLLMFSLALPNANAGATRLETGSLLSPDAEEDINPFDTDEPPADATTQGYVCWVEYLPNRQRVAFRVRNSSACTNQDEVIVWYYLCAAASADECLHVPGDQLYSETMLGTLLSALQNAAISKQKAVAYNDPWNGTYVWFSFLTQQ